MITLRASLAILSGLLLVTACKKDNDNNLNINPCGIDFNTTLHYVAIGDGFCSGLYLDATEAWPSIVVTRLEDQGFQVTDFSVFGAVDATSQDLNAQVNTNNPTCKNVATIMVGAQDQFEGRSLDEFRADYRSLINKAVALTGSVDRVTCVTLPNYSSAPGLPSSAGTTEMAEAKLMAMNAIISEETDMAGVNLANIFPISGSLYANANAYTPEDELHADADQQLAWAEIIAFVIQSNF
jgi:lysophospholipase L1-like esterase